MSVSIPLQTMSITEKILVMELIWDDLCLQAENIIFPEWHESVLYEREDAVKQGIDIFTDWEIAKKKLRSELDEN